MATSSFDKDFRLTTQKEVDQFIELLEKPAKSIPIDRNLTKFKQLSPEEAKQLLSKIPK